MLASFAHVVQLDGADGILGEANDGPAVATQLPQGDVGSLLHLKHSANVPPTSISNNFLRLSASQLLQDSANYLFGKPVRELALEWATGKAERSYKWTG